MYKHIYIYIIYIHICLYTCIYKSQNRQHKKQVGAHLEGMAKELASSREDRRILREHLADNKANHAAQVFHLVRQPNSIGWPVGIPPIQLERP